VTQIVGMQQIVPAALSGGSGNVKTLTFLTEEPDVRRRSLGVTIPAIGTITRENSAEAAALVQIRGTVSAWA